jgi:hypothetical protein
MDPPIIMLIRSAIGLLKYRLFRHLVPCQAFHVESYVGSEVTSVPKPRMLRRSQPSSSSAFQASRPSLSTSHTSTSDVTESIHHAPSAS